MLAQKFANPLHMSLQCSLGNLRIHCEATANEPAMFAQKFAKDSCAKRGLIPLRLVLQEGDYDQRLVADWDNLIWPTSLLLAELTDDMAFHDAVQVSPLAPSLRSAWLA